MSNVEPRNPSCWFYQTLGAEWLCEDNGEVNHNWYVWRDLPAPGVHLPHRMSGD